MDDRVAAQRAIEQVYWSHRIWPQENPGPKPALETLVTEAELRAKVEDSLRKGRALDRYWRSPITHDQLQAEMNRMARDSRSPEILIELFHALGDDPTKIAECLARPLLADRLVRNWQAADSRASISGQSFETWWARVSPELSAMVEDDAESYAPVSPDAVGCTDNTWTPTKTEGPDPLTRSRAVWTGSEMIVWGGADYNLLSTRGYRYSPATDTWSLMSVVGAPLARGNHTMIWTGSLVVVWGGSLSASAQASLGNTGGRYNPVTDTWTPTSLGANVPAPRERHTAVWTGSRMVIWSGQTPFTTTGLQSGGRYDPVSDTWSTMSTVGAPSGSALFEAVWTGTRVIEWGQSSNGGLYDPVADTWSPMAPATPTCPPTSTPKTTVWTGSRMLAWSGCTTASGLMYDPASNTWSPMTATGEPSPRFGFSVVWTGSRMIVWGGAGFDTFNTPTNTGFSFDPVANSWSPMSTGANVPSPRPDHVAVWTGTQMIVWGGGKGSPLYLDDGARYTPSTDTWVPIAHRTTAPSPRQRHLAVWTGAEMIVYGGSSWDGGAGPLTDHGRYDPATDTWTSIPASITASSAVWTGFEMILYGNGGSRYRPIQNDWRPTTNVNDPSEYPADARHDHSAVWTGTQMIIWGGRRNSSAYYSTGGRYDPRQDKWFSMSATNQPSARSGHSAVWTGSVMVVWGNDFTPDNTGGRYDPVNNSWAPTSTGAGCPSARKLSAAVWTGSEMIVMGGVNAVGNTENTGGRYNAAADTWTTMTPAPVPGMYRHTLVWTGTEMILWGGDNGTAGARSNQGARYTPATNSWALTEAGVTAPAGRARHTAVRTESEMIVWGGEPTTASGGRYCTTPCTPQTWYRDADGDGYGDNNVTQSSCVKPAGYTYLAGDCNDASTAANPYGTEVCDGLDNDCNGVADDPFNLDHDAFATCQGDCNDNDATIYPGAPQICDGKNNNCSDPSWPAVPANEANADGDAFRICGGDCNDADSTVFPGATQLCDGKNNNCQDPAWPTVPANELDGDADGFRVCQNDCNDANPAVHPGATEICNGIDDDCSGQFDDDALGVDSDADGVRNVCDNCRTVSNASQTDTDHDNVGNACDNCPALINADQTDTDGDSFGDACDNCKLAPNVSQADTDLDRAGDACDNCFFDFNPNQTDFNGDGEGDVCDVDDGLIYVFGTDDKNFIEWQGETGPTSWNVYEGDLATLKSTGVYTQDPGSNPQADRHCGLTDVFQSDPDLPPAGRVTYHLVTGITGGTEGSLGTNSAGTPRPNTNPCP